MNSESRNTHGGRWSSFPDDYCEKEISCIANAISSQHSCVVVGGSGTGKSNLSGYITMRPKSILDKLPNQEYLFCTVDINKLSQSSPTYFYRGMLRALYKAAKRENLSVASDLYQLEVKTRDWNDEQSWSFAIEDAHELVVGQSKKHLVWLFDRFDKACPTLESSILDTLRSLRDEDLFYGKIYYLVFSRKPLQRLRDWQVNSEFLEIVENNTCWVGPLSKSDTEWRIQDLAERHGGEILAFDQSQIWDLTGGLAAYVKAVSEAWLKGEISKNMPLASIQTKLLKLKSIRRTSREILTDLTPTERDVLIKIASGTTQVAFDQEALEYIENNGLVVGPEGNRKIFSPLFKAYLNEFQENMPGFLSRNPITTEILRDGFPANIRLTKMEDNLFSFMLEHPNQLLTHEQLVDHLYGTDVGKDDKAAMLAQMGNLKNKLPPDVIVSTRGRGYTLNQPEITEEYEQILKG